VAPPPPEDLAGAVTVMTVSALAVAPDPSVTVSRIV
jgi:hypothetical protein